MTEYRPGDLSAALGRALRKVADDIRDTAAERTPKESGSLAESLTVTVDGDTAAISSDSPYAVRQHESMRVHHPHGGQAKFLESAMGDAVRTAGATITREVRRELGL